MCCNRHLSVNKLQPLYWPINEMWLARNLLQALVNRLQPRMKKPTSSWYIPRYLTFVQISVSYDPLGEERRQIHQAMRWHCFIMTSSRSVTAALQRNLARRAPTRAAAQFPRRSFQTTCRPRPSQCRSLRQQHAFSISIPRTFATVEDDFDPNSIERESDQVDVCIVGGGMCLMSNTMKSSR